MEQYLGEKVAIIIDRPIGTYNLERDYIYPVNFGYIPKIKTEDGNPVEAYLVGEFQAVTSCNAYVEAIVETDGVERLILCKEEGQYTKEQLESLVEFNERFYDSDIMTEEDDDDKDEDDSFPKCLGLGLLVAIFGKPEYIKAMLVLVVIRGIVYEYIETSKYKALFNEIVKLIVWIFIIAVGISYIPRLF